LLCPNCGMTDPTARIECCRSVSVAVSVTSRCCIKTVDLPYTVFKETSIGPMSKIRVYMGTFLELCAELWA